MLDATNEKKNTSGKNCVRTSQPSNGVPPAAAAKKDAYYIVRTWHAPDCFRWRRKGVKFCFRFFRCSFRRSHVTRVVMCCVFNIIFYPFLLLLLVFFAVAFDGKGVLFGTEQNIKHVFCIRIRLHYIYNEATITPSTESARYHYRVCSVMHGWLQYV